jgi:molybdenum cofactor synthesis domain-containing protein
LDTSGPALAEMVRTRLGGRVVATACVPDEADRIAHQIKAWATETPRPDLILTTGGTGLSPRDVTPEATLSVLERRHASLMELVRLRCSATGPRVFLSRGEAGTVAGSLVINLPGSQRGASECLAALLDLLPHAIETLHGEVQDDGRPDATPQSGKVVGHQE